MNHRNTRGAQEHANPRSRPARPRSGRAARLDRAEGSFEGHLEGGVRGRRGRHRPNADREPRSPRARPCSRSRCAPRRGVPGAPWSPGMRTWKRASPVRVTRSVSRIPRWIAWAIGVATRFSQRAGSGVLPAVAGDHHDRGRAPVAGAAGRLAMERLLPGDAGLERPEGTSAVAEQAGGLSPSAARLRAAQERADGLVDALVGHLRQREAGCASGVGHGLLDEGRAARSGPRRNDVPPGHHTLPETSADVPRAPVSGPSTAF